jgi:CheY-like chemotaxis protein
MAHRILVVDDEPSVVSSVAELLRFRDYEVITAKDGQEGLNRCIGNHLDLVICDINMPVMSGGELIARLRSLLPNLPIIASSGQYLDLPPGVDADAFLPKGSYSIHELFALVDKLITFRLKP